MNTITEPKVCNYKHWVKQNMWSQRQAACILTGTEPEVKTPAAHEIYIKMRLACKNGLLKKASTNNKRVHFYQSAVIKWAAENKLELAAELNILLQKKADLRRSRSEAKIAPDKPKNPRRCDAIDKLIVTLETRANEQGKTIDWRGMPGKRAHLFELAHKIDGAVYKKGNEGAFMGWLKDNGKLKFMKGRGATNDFYKELFPEHYPSE